MVQARGGCSTSSLSLESKRAKGKPCGTPISEHNSKSIGQTEGGDTSNIYERHLKLCNLKFGPVKFEDSLKLYRKINNG